MAFVILALLAVVVVVVRRLRRGEDPAACEIDKAGEHTTIDPETGAVTSVQAADLTMSAQQLEAIWTPARARSSFSVPNGHSVHLACV
jgi:hypothetical protein